MPRRKATTAALILILAIGACTTGAASTTSAGPLPTAAPIDLVLPATRPFSMGFTRWPYAFHQEAVDWTWRALREHSDLVAIHLDTGVPWDEAAAGEPFPARVQADLEDAARRSSEFATTYVAVTPLHSDRATIAWYWNDEGTQQPLPARWEGRPVDDPEVIAAYLDYCLRVIDTLDPDWFAYGIEVNAGYQPGSPEHESMLGLATAIYPALKAHHPDLPVFLTFQIGSWEAGNVAALEIAESLVPWSDITGISAYPFLDLSDPLRSEAMPGPVEEWMSRFAAFDKPIAVGETGYAAEPLVIPTLGVDTLSTPDWQAGWVADLLATAARYEAEFVVYWEIRDYDEGYEFLLDLGVDSDLAVIWRDIGLFDGAGAPRPGLAVWDAWLGLPGP